LNSITITFFHYAKKSVNRTYIGSIKKSLKTYRMDEWLKVLSILISIKQR
jgi:hypothetical protein